MPTVFSHPVVAFALAPWLRGQRIGWRLLATGAACTMLPDADVITRHIDGPWPVDLLHRGLTHSFVFAALLAALLATSARRAWAPVTPLAAFVFLFLCTASHGVFDAFTDGGPGVMFGWPVTDARVFAPWRPIEVSPLDADRFFSSRGLAVLASELLWVWLPGVLVAGLGVLLRRRDKAVSR